MNNAVNIFMRPFLENFQYYSKNILKNITFGQT